MRLCVRLLPLALSFPFVLEAQDREAANPSGDAIANRASDADQTDLEAARRARLIVRIGERRITVGEIEDQIARQSPMMRARYRDPAQLAALVDNIVRFELLAAAAERELGSSLPEVRKTTARTAVQAFLRERFDERIRPDTVPAEDVRTYYETHPEEFHEPESRRVSHILVATREEAEAIAREVRDADARAFRTLAQQRTLDAETRARGGDLRYFDERGHGPNDAEASVDPAIVRAAFALRTVGDVSPPVEVGGQWTVVKLTGLHPAQHRDLAQATPQIRERLWHEERERAIEALITELRSRTSIERNDDRMRNIHMDPPARISHDDEHGSVHSQAE